MERGAGRSLARVQSLHIKLGSQEIITPLRLNFVNWGLPESMNHLVIYGHPNPESFNHAVLNTYADTLREQGHDVVIRNLYELKFDPVLNGSDFEALQSGNIPADIKAEQEHISRADVLTLIYPIWWTGMPAVLKGYIDRVLSYGFAYAYGEDGSINKLLSGKRGFIINTQGSPKDYYDAIGMTEALKKTSDTGIFEFCGIESVGHLFFGSVPQAEDEELRQMLAQVKDAAGKFGGKQLD